MGGPAPTPQAWLSQQRPSGDHRSAAPDAHLRQVSKASVVGTSQVGSRSPGVVGRAGRLSLWPSSRSHSPV